MIEESTAAIKVAVQWLATPFRFAVGYHRIYINPEVGRVGHGTFFGEWLLCGCPASKIFGKETVRLAPLKKT